MARHGGRATLNCLYTSSLQPLPVSLTMRMRPP
jgi:hypothetical protein